MKNFSRVFTVLFLITLCGCSKSGQTSETRFLLDTVVTISADCRQELINQAFEKISDYEKLFSVTVENSDVSKLNRSLGEFTEVNNDTYELIGRCVHYSEITGGKFDITVRPLTRLWDFKLKTVPSKDEISEALRRVGYGSIEESDGKINLNGANIDLGAAAKG